MGYTTTDPLKKSPQYTIAEWHPQTRKDVHLNAVYQVLPHPYGHRETITGEYVEVTQIPDDMETDVVTSTGWGIDVRRLELLGRPGDPWYRDFLSRAL